MRFARHVARALWPAAACCAAGCAAGESERADPFTRTGELVALSGGDAGAPNACFTCHGLDGGGDGAGTPRLAGLDFGYLTAQLNDYARGRRRHAEMEYIARRLGPVNREKVAAYYAGLTIPATASATPGPPPPLFERGDPVRGIPACASCHGPDGRGIGAANPPLAGQPAGYLAEQMERWRAGKRRGDPQNLMLDIARRMTPGEIRSVAAYAASLPAVSPRPEYPAASPTARRDDPRSDASAPPRRGAGRGS